MLLYFLLLSIALSIDALGIGISYRLNGVTIPTKSKVTIGLVTTIIMFVALMTGGILHEELPQNLSGKLGAVVLAVIGGVFMVQSMTQKQAVAYDLDHSRAIEPLEGILLAIALSTDSIGAGIAVASTGGARCYLGILVGVFQLCFLYIADFLVLHIPMIRKFNRKLCGFFSGFLLVIIGILRFFC